jgi:hypothetical protein
MKRFLLACCLLAGCGRDTRIAPPDLIENNPVRPEQLTKPLSEVTNALQQAPTNGQPRTFPNESQTDQR